LRKVQRNGQPGEPAANNGDIEFHVRDELVDSGTIGDLAFGRSARRFAFTKSLVRAASIGPMLNEC
jgi:hypothetical protein